MGHLTIVTGGSSGIGAELALQAAAEAHDVLVVSRRQGPVGRHLQADLATSMGWDAFEERINSEIEGHDAVDLYHSAGTVTPIGFAGEVDPAGYRASVLLNGAAPQIIGEAMLRAAARAGAKATLVLITSGAARSPYPGWSAYCAGKAATDMWTRTVGAEQAERQGAKVVAIAPGVVDTPMQGEIRSSNETDFPNVERFRGMFADGGLADPAEVARRIRRAIPALDNGAVVDLRDL